MRNHLLLAFALVTGLSPGPAIADPPLTPASLVPCPFTPGEIEATLGLRVNAGEAADMKIPGGRDVGCIYQVIGGSTTLAIRQTWDDSGGKAGTAAAAGSKRGRTKAVPGDPDGALLKVSGGNENDPQVELSYTRGNVKTRVLVHGRSFRSTEIQPRMLRLRRVP